MPRARVSGPAVLALALLLGPGPWQPALAGPFAFEDVVLEVPSGFLGPEVRRLAGGVSTASFATFDNCGLQSTTLQLTVREAGGAQEALLAAAEVPRAGFVAGKPEPIRLGELPGYRMAWRGDETVGVSYAFALGSKLISVHAHAQGEQPSGPMLEAVRAIEALRVQRRLP
jgi:hypothetical protein